MNAARLASKFNDVALLPPDDLSEPFPNPYPPMPGPLGTLAAWSVPAALLRDGANRLEVTLAAGEAVELAFLDLGAK